MSKEKQCECCHEWWYGSDVKEDLCPNCYDYFKQLKQQLEEKDKVLELKLRLKGSTKELDKTVNDMLHNENQRLIQQLAEKQKTIDEINKEFVQAVHDWKVLCAKKDNEIERLNTIIGLSQLQVSKKDRLNTSVNINSLQYNQTQLAIQELEKVKVNLKDRISMMKNEEHSYLQKVVAWYDICDQINKQIKELKGE